MAISFAISLLSVVPMRKEPAHRSEMVSQLLFGEYVEVLGEEKDFIQVRCIYDNYEGWVQKNQLTSTTSISSTDIYTGEWTTLVQVKDQTIHVPFGAPVITAPITTQGSVAIQYNTAVTIAPKDIATPGSLSLIYNQFLHTPYLWGGKSVFGIDCSGFVQQVFKLVGIPLLRDAYLQAEQGVSVNNLEESRVGDLAFFHNENGRITHVGIIVENNAVVHASGKVRKDTLTEEGIINSETGKKTHDLSVIRRVF